MAKLEEKIEGTLPLKIENLLIWIHKVTGLERFILYGGAPLDLLINHRSRITDLDIAVNNIEKKLIKKTQKNLIKNGFKIVEAERKYYINIMEPVILTYAKNDRYFLDIAFLKNIKLIGQFNIDSLYCRYPKFDCIDRFCALEGYKRKTIHPIRSLDKENPYLLSNIFIKLCSKYNFKLASNPKHKEIIDALMPKLEKWKPPNAFHKTDAPASVISGILKSIIRAQDRRKFIKELAESGILKAIIPEIQKPLLEFDKLDNNTKRKLLGCKKKLELTEVLWDIVSPNERSSLKKKLELLRIRNWSFEDKKIGKIFSAKI